MTKKTGRERLELPRHLAMPVLILVLMTIPWFTGGRDAFGLFLISLLTTLLYASWFVVSRHRALRITSTPKLIIWPLAGLAILSTVSLLWSVGRFDTLGQLIVFISAGLSFVIARDIFSEEKLAAQFFRWLWLVMATVVVLVGMGMFIAGDYERLTSLFYWPNPMATFLLPALFVGWQALSEAKGRASWLLLAVNGIIGAGFILTYSRAAWLIALIGAGAWVALEADWRKRLRHIGLSFLLAAVITAALVTTRGALFKRSTIDVQRRVAESGQSTSVNDRFAYWREATAMFSVRPLLGWGAGTYREVHPAYQESPSTAGSNPHSSFFQTMVELGAAGVITYILLIVGWLKLGWELIRTKKDRTSWVVTTWLIVSAMGLHSLLDLGTNYPVLIVTGAIWLSLALPAPKKWFEFRLKSWKFGLPWLAMGLVSLVFSWLSFTMYSASLDKSYVDIVAPFDWQEANGLYTKLYARPVFDPDYLSYGVIQAVDRFETIPDISASDLDRWEAYARRATELEPRDAKHVFALGAVEERQGKVTEALNHYRQAIELDPYDNPQYQVAYALLLRREGFVADAQRILRGITAAYTPQVLANRGITNLPLRLSAAYALMADMKHEQGDPVGAETDLEQAQKLDPTSQSVQQLRQKWTPTK